jgi:hypothetical protein
MDSSRINDFLIYAFNNEEIGLIRAIIINFSHFRLDSSKFISMIEDLQERFFELIERSFERTKNPLYQTFLDNLFKNFNDEMLVTLKGAILKAFINDNTEAIDVIIHFDLIRFFTKQELELTVKKPENKFVKNYFLNMSTTLIFGEDINHEEIYDKRIALLRDLECINKIHELLKSDPYEYLPSYMYCGFYKHFSKKMFEIFSSDVIFRKKLIDIMDSGYMTMMSQNHVEKFIVEASKGSVQNCMIHFLEGLPSNLKKDAIQGFEDLIESYIDSNEKNLAREYLKYLKNII